MQLRIVLFLAIAGAYQKFGYAALPGSGDGELINSNRRPPISTDDDDSDIYIEGSGALPETTDIVEGSGSDPTTPSMLNMECSAIYCWCKFNNGTEVQRTRVYQKRPENCAQYGVERSTAAASTTTTRAPIPTRARVETPAPNVGLEETMTHGGDDFTVVEEEKTTAKTTVKPTVPVVIVTASSGKPMINKIPAVTDKPKVFRIDEGREEESNVISGTDTLISKDVEEEKVSKEGGMVVTHPGILAAIIGGAVVGLLCAILLVMFIIYRMRKKDEGSYPLNDTKPLKNYAYAKAPSREFYA